MEQDHRRATASGLVVEPSAGYSDTACVDVDLLDARRNDARVQGGRRHNGS